MKTLIPHLLLTLALLAGCKTGIIKTASGIELNAPPDASGPSSVKEGQKTTTTKIPEGTTVVNEKIAATNESPAIERETTTYTAPAEKVETEIKNEMSVSAPRAPDQTVALHKVDVAERRVLLYAGIGALVLAALLLYAGQRDLGIVAGSIAAALLALWYAPWLLIVSAGLVVLGAGWWIYSQYRQKSKTEEALRRTVQTVEELKIDNPAAAKEFMEYQSSNLDSEHKTLLQAIKPSIDYKYIQERFANKSHQP